MVDYAKGSDTGLEKENPMSKYNETFAQTATFPLAWYSTNQDLYGTHLEYAPNRIPGDPDRPAGLKSIPIFSALSKLREKPLGDWAISTITSQYRERGGLFGEPDFWILEDCIFSMEDFLESNDPLNGGSVSRGRQLAVKLNRIRNSVWV